MTLFRKLLLKLLGLKGYYVFISRIYITLTASGFFKKKYPELFYLKKIIKPGFVCIDIGANMGYYSTFLSRLTGSAGKIYSVEPVPLFVSILQSNIKSTGLNNVEILPYALGEKNQPVKMGTPVVEGLIHHGMTKILSLSDEKYEHYYEVEMKVPDELFSRLSRLDFIKCDIEGYEYYAFSNMMQVINKFKPLIQSELSGEEGRGKVINLLSGSGYKVHRLNTRDELVPLTDAEVKTWSSDFYFIHK